MIGHKMGYLNCQNTAKYNLQTCVANLNTSPEHLVDVLSVPFIDWHNGIIAESLFLVASSITAFVEIECPSSPVISKIRP